MEKILLAVDGSEHSMRAATTAGELSKNFGAPVTIINVVPEASMAVPVEIQEYAQLEHVYLTERDLLRSAGSDIVGQAARKVAEAGGDVDAQEVEVGSPASVIVARASAIDADCIVMGRRGLSDIKGLFMGSVSNRVGQLTDKTLVTSE